MKPVFAKVEGLEQRALFDATLVTNNGDDVSVDDVQLRTYVTQHEGLKQFAYRDERTGRAKIGFGFDLRRRGAREVLQSLNLDQRQLLREAKTAPAEVSIGSAEALQLFNADVAIAIDAAQDTFDGFADFSHRQQVALVDIAFTSGVKQLRKLRKAVEAAADDGEWAAAAEAIENSRYARSGLAAERVADTLVLIQSVDEPGTPAPPPSAPDPSPTPTPEPTPTPTPAPAPLSPPLVEPAGDGRHGVRVAAGRVTLPDGRTVDVAGGVLDVDVPEIKPHSRTFTDAADYAGQAEGVRWPDWSVNLVPTADTLVLGGLYNAVVPSSVVVENSSGEVMVRDVDYKLNETWGQILELNDRLGDTETYTVNYRIVKQRLDLVQVLPDGSVSVKRGTTAQLCPVLPESDAGAVALAGIHVYTLDGARESGFTLQARDILPINPAPPVMPVNPEAMPETLAKLRAGGDVNIAFFGDSITDGAEAGKWWEDRSQTYTSLVVEGLRARFPGATVTGTLASQGGRGATDSQEVFQERVLDPHNAGNRVDLVVIAMGMNDKGKPTLDPFKAAMNQYIDQARAAGMEVLLVTPMQSNPYYEPSQTDRVPRARIAEAILEVGDARDATTVDVHTEWNNMATRGIAPVSQLHNLYNHPAAFGMRLYADTILRAFPA